MAVGTYLVKASDLTMSHYAKLEYKNEQNKFYEIRRIEINCRIADDQRASRLLVDGKASIHGMPLIMTIELGMPFMIEDPISSQTKLIKNVESQVVFPFTLGHVSYEKGSTDTESLIELPQGLYGYVILSSQLFNELWNLAKTGNAIKHIYVELFGSQMVERDSVGQIEYVWQTSDEEGFGDINISSFEYSF